MLQVTAWPDVRDDAQWYKLPQSKKSLHKAGVHSELKRVYHYEPAVFRDGVINVPIRFWGGQSFVLVAKKNFVAIWSYEQQTNRWSRSGYILVTWFRYYFEPEEIATATASVQVIPAPTAIATSVGSGRERARPSKAKVRPL